MMPSSIKLRLTLSAKSYVQQLFTTYCKCKAYIIDCVQAESHNVIKLPNKALITLCGSNKTTVSITVPRGCRLILVSLQKLIRWKAVHKSGTCTRS